MTTELQIKKDMISFNGKLNNNLETFWFVLYTYPKAEKIAFNNLIKKDYEVFLPITKTLKIWKNRQKKWIDQVLFPSYIFIKTTHSELFNIVKISKVVKYVHCAGKPSIISLKEIEGIKKILGLEQEIIIDSNICIGEKVKIIYGPLAGYEGILVNQKGKTRFGIQLKEINQTIYVDICSSILEKIQK